MDQQDVFLAYIFATKQFEDAFHRHDQTIVEAARTIPGYLGEEAWENASTGLTSNVYYWESPVTDLPTIQEARTASADQAEWRSRRYS